MDPVTTPFERGLHLLLFVSAVVALGVAAIALIERLSDGSRRTVRVVHVAATGIVFGALFVAERIFHAAH